MLHEFKLPDIGEGVVEGEIVRWLVEEGQGVVEDQPIVEVMTDKATVEIPSPVGGRVARRHGEEGSIITVGSVLVEIETDNETLGGEAPRVFQTATIDVPDIPLRASKVLATPAVRKLARESRIDLNQVEGSGPSGRVTLEDLARFQSRPEPDETQVQSETTRDAEELVPYRGLRRKIGEHMRAAKVAAPHYTYVEEVDVTELSRLRGLYNKLADARLTYLPFMVKAVIEGLHKYPLLNSSLDEENGVVRVKKYYNIGIATATDDGLVVPVVKEADRKSIVELAREIARLSEAAREGKLKVEQLRGGTFTITSLGALGGLFATPIINHPEVAVLGLHKISPRPVVVEDRITVRQMMNVSVSLDHRVVDGAVAAGFVAHVRLYLENPGLLALEPV